MVESNVQSFVDPLLGRSLKSTRFLRAGQVVMEEQAWISWNVDEMIENIMEWQFITKDALLVSTLVAYQLNYQNPCFSATLDEFMHCSKELAKEISQTVENLLKAVPQFCGDNKLSHDQCLQFVLTCFTNAHSYQIMDKKHCGLFRSASQMNHSCSPNTVFYMDSDRLMFKALRDIEKNEELTCSYADEITLISPVKWRRSYLLRQKFFMCQCQRCNQEIDEEELAADDFFNNQNNQILKPMELHDIDKLFRHLTELPPDSQRYMHYLAFTMLKFANNLMMMREQLPGPSIKLARINEMLVISCWLLNCALVDILMDTHIVLLTKWIHEGFFGLPVWTEWFVLLNDSPAASASSEISYKTTPEQWLSLLNNTWNDPQSLPNQSISVSWLVAQLSKKTWKQTKNCLRQGFISFDRSDIQFFKDCSCSK